MSGIDVAGVAEDAALLLTAAGVVVAALVWLTTRAWHPTVPVLLDFLLAAGLLRLSADDTWHAIVAAAAIVAVRALVKTGTASRTRADHHCLVAPR